MGHPGPSGCWILRIQGRGCDKREGKIQGGGGVKTPSRRSYGIFVSESCSNITTWGVGVSL